MSRAPDLDGEPLADIEIGAAASAKRLRFNSKPQVEVEFETGPDGESDSQTERENLPEEVQPGVTYRDVRVAWRGGARFVVPSGKEPASPETGTAVRRQRARQSERRRHAVSSCPALSRSVRTGEP